MSEEKRFYTRFEKARIIGTRAMQIAAGAPPLVKTKEGDPIKIAEEEFEKGVCPLIVKPKMPIRQKETVEETEKDEE